MHAHEMHVYEMHTYETPNGREMHACKMRVYEVHAHRDLFMRCMLMNLALGALLPPGMW
jgi:hypothetical protein